MPGEIGHEGGESTVTKEEEYARRITGEVPLEDFLSEGDVYASMSETGEDEVEDEEDHVANATPEAFILGRDSWFVLVG